MFLEKGLNVVTQPDPANDNVSLKSADAGRRTPFVYQVQMRGYFTPSFARGGMGPKELRNRRYYWGRSERVKAARTTT